MLTVMGLLIQYSSFCKEQKEYSFSDVNRGLVRSSGFVESSTDVCGNGVSSSPAQITLALGVQEVSVDKITHAWNLCNAIFFS